MRSVSRWAKFALFTTCFLSTTLSHIPVAIAKDVYPGFIDQAARDLYGPTASFKYTCTACHVTGTQVTGGTQFMVDFANRAFVNRFAANNLTAIQVRAIISSMALFDSDKDNANTEQELRFGSNPADPLSFPPPLCVRAAPAIQLEPAMQAADPGAARDYVINLTNRDSAGCPATMISLQESLPQDLSGVLSFAQMSLSPGQSISGSIRVSSMMNALPGDYTFTITAANGAAPNLATTATATLSVNVVKVCTRAAPTVALTPPSQSADPGATLSYGIQVKNNDSLDCPATTISLQESLPAGLNASLSLQSVSLNPGESAQAQISVASAMNAAAGDYTFSVMATHSADVSLKASANAIYQVNLLKVCTPAAPALSLTPTIQNGALGETLSYVFSITNQDSADCAASAFALALAPGASLEGSIGVTQALLNPGQNAQATVLVRALMSALPGEHTFLVQVSSPGQPAHSAQVAGTLVLASQTDVTAPDAPTGLTFKKGRRSTYVIRWTAVSDASGIAKYLVYADGVLRGETHIPAIGLRFKRRPNIVEVIAVDGAGNNSPKSAPLYLRKPEQDNDDD